MGSFFHGFIWGIWKFHGRFIRRFFRNCCREHPAEINWGWKKTGVSQSDTLDTLPNKSENLNFRNWRELQLIAATKYGRKLCLALQENPLALDAVEILLLDLTNHMGIAKQLLNKLQVLGFIEVRKSGEKWVPVQKPKGIIEDLREALQVLGIQANITSKNWKRIVKTLIGPERLEELNKSLEKYRLELDENDIIVYARTDDNAVMLTAEGLQVCRPIIETAEKIKRQIDNWDTEEDLPTHI